MRKSLSLLCRMYRIARHISRHGEGTRLAGKRASLALTAGLLLGSILLAACSSPFGGVSSTPTPATRPLSKIGWCAKPLLIFHDERAGTPTATANATSTATVSGTPTAGPGTPSTLSDWPTVKAALGFTVYLPTMLPNGSCLLSAQATVHDPTYGGNFVIGYLLPDHTSLSISEAPLTTQQVAFQCNPTNSTVPTANGQAGTPTPTSTETAIQLCSGAKEKTNIVLAGPGSTSMLQQIFSHLQTNVNWIPAS